MDVSGSVIDLSGSVIDVSGSVIDVSGSVIDLSGSVIDVSGSVIDVSGSVIDVSGSILGLGSNIAIIPTPPPPIRLEDILSSQQLLCQQETADKTALESIGTISYDTLKPRLIQWASAGFPNAYVIYDIPMRAPPLCSDGVARSLQDYIEFVSGTSIAAHVSVLQARLPDFVVSYAYSGYSILIVVSKSG